MSDAKHRHSEQGIARARGYFEAIDDIRVMLETAALQVDPSTRESMFRTARTIAKWSESKVRETLARDESPVACLMMELGMHYTTDTIESVSDALKRSEHKRRS